MSRQNTLRHQTVQSPAWRTRKHAAYTRIQKMSMLIDFQMFSINVFKEPHLGTYSAQQFQNVSVQNNYRGAAHNPNYYTTA